MHVTWQLDTDAKQLTGASQAEPPSQSISHVGAEQSRPPPHALAFKQLITHFDPPHLTLPPQLEGPMH
jgi:hypothetical protein